MHSFQLRFFFFFVFILSTTVRVGLWLPTQFSTIPDVLWPLPASFYSHYIYFLFNLVPILLRGLPRFLPLERLQFVFIKFKVTYFRLYSFQCSGDWWVINWTGYKGGFEPNQNTAPRICLQGLRKTK